MLGLVVLETPFPKSSALLCLDPPILGSPGPLDCLGPFEDQEVDKSLSRLLKDGGWGGTDAKDGGARGWSGRPGCSPGR